MQKQKIFLSLNGRANYPGYSNNGISSSIVNTEPTNRCRKDGNSILNNLPKLKLKYWVYNGRVMVFMFLYDLFLVID